MTEAAAKRGPTGPDPANYLILVVDDLMDNAQLLAAHLRSRGYRTALAYNGTDALKLAIQQQPDLIMMDVNMPGLSGLDVCSQLKNHPKTANIQVILVTANSASADIVTGFEVGADDYLIKPYNYMEMLARVRSMLRIRHAQQELIRANEKLDELNRSLEDKVREQVGELERVGRLRRFFSPAIANSIVSENAEHILNDHRREVTVVFLDLRRFTAFADQSSPQEVISTIRELHGVVGPIIFACNGTLERFAGDGLMVFLGDPEPMPDHPLQAVRMCMQIREATKPLVASWQARGYDLEVAMGAATGIASVGTIGFEGRLDYAAIGTVTNLASRLCSGALGGQILINQATHDFIAGDVRTEHVGDIELKGFSAPQPAYAVLGTCS